MTDLQPNLAGRLARAFITSKMTVVFIIGVTLLGMLAIMTTPREENPQILVPDALVSVSLPGASAAEVENLIVTPLEGILGEITGVDHTYGIAQESLGLVQVQFKVGQSKEDSLVKLYDRVISNRNRLPPDAGTPLIRDVDVDDLPILTITLASSHYDDYGLKRVADRIAERLRSVPDVSVVSVRGGRDREISIELDPDRLQAFGVTLSQVNAAFETNNVSAELPGPVIDHAETSIKLSGFLKSAEEVRKLIVGISAGRPIYVGDIAVVKDGPPSEIGRFSRFSFGPGDSRFQDHRSIGMPAVAITIAKKKGTNAVIVSDRIVDRFDRMRASLLPADVCGVVTRDDGKKADDAVNMLIEHLGVAIFTVSFILTLFLGWKEALIVTVTVPLIFSITLAADLFSGVTINRVTLFALILSLGLLVDAAIVVIENIHRHYSSANGAGKLEATILATNEIGSATNLATLAVMLVFGSLLLVTGMPGDYFYPIAIDVPIAMAGSVVVAYVVAPWAANRWLAHHETMIDEDQPAVISHDQRDRLQRLYISLVTPLLRRPKARQLLGLLVLFSMIASILQGAWQFIRPAGVGGPVSSLGVGLGFLPKDNKNTFNILVFMPESAPIENTDQFTREIELLLANNVNVLNYQSWIGGAGVPDSNSVFQGTSDRQGSSVGEIRVNLVDKHDRSASSIDIVRDLRPRVEAIRLHYPGAKVRLVEDPPGPPLRATVLAEIYGPDPNGLRALSVEVRKAFGNTFDMVDISDSEAADVAEYSIVPDKEKAALSNVSTAQISMALQMVYGGLILGRAHPAGEKNSVDIRAYVPRRYEVQPTHLDRVFVSNATGEPVPISELVKERPAIRDRQIQHKDDERVTYVGGELSRTVPLYAVLDLNRRLNGITAPDGRPLRTGNLTLVRQSPDVIDGYTLLWDGEMRMTLDIYRDMGIALGTALMLVFLVLISYYRSFIIPLIAMSSVPLGIIGIFPGHWIARADFSSTSMVGIIALSGVVIRNSLLIIDFIRENIRLGMPLEDAVKQAGAVRLRPILLTTLAIVLGSAIMVTDPVFGGLAISLISGTVVSTILTVFIVPILFYIYERYKIDVVAVDSEARRPPTSR